MGVPSKAAVVTPSSPNRRRTRRRQNKSTTKRSLFDPNDDHCAFLTNNKQESAAKRSARDSNQVPASPKKSRSIATRTRSNNKRRKETVALKDEPSKKREAIEDDVGRVKSFQKTEEPVLLEELDSGEQVVVSKNSFGATAFSPNKVKETTSVLEDTDSDSDIVATPRRSSNTKRRILEEDSGKESDSDSQPKALRVQRKILKDEESDKESDSDTKPRARRSTTKDEDSRQRRRKLRRERKKERQRQKLLNEVADLEEYTESVLKQPPPRQDKSQRQNEDSNEDTESEDQSDVVQHPIEPVCSICPGVQLMQGAVDRNRNVYFSCHVCKSFTWAKNVTRKHYPSGPPCHDCQQPSSAILDRETGQAKWVCSNTNQQACSFEEAIPEGLYERQQVVQNAESVRRTIQVQASGATDKEFLVDSTTKRHLQELFHVSFEDSSELREEPTGYHDFLEVAQAWKISPPEQSVADFEEFRLNQRRGNMVPTSLRPEFERAAQNLVDSGCIKPLDAESNEVLLIHGTKPEVADSILEKSLDPKMARNGLFGAGTYFAEHPLKVHQYATCEESWNRKSRLHQKLYPTADIFPGNVRYALVARVVLGEPDVTKGGLYHPSGSRHSIRAELGGKINKFREFVIFDKRAIKLEYLVCYKLSKRYCSCGIPARERSMQENGRNRSIITCDKSYKLEGRWVGGCGLFAMLPRCFCPNKRGQDFFSAVPREREGCYNCRDSRCRFSEQIDPTVEHESSSDEEDEDQYDFNDGFLEKG